MINTILSIYDKFVTMIKERRFFSLTLILLFAALMYIHTGIILDYKFNKVKAELTDTLKGLYFAENKYFISDETYIKMNVMLDEVRSKVNADRVYCFIYHDGLESLDGLHFQRATQVFERVNYGIKSTSQNNQNVSMSFFTYQNEKFGKYGGGVYTPSVNELKNIDITLYSHFKGQNIESVYRQTFFGMGDFSVKGFIGVDFVNRESHLTESQIAILKDAAIQARILLYDVKTRGVKL